MHSAILTTWLAAIGAVYAAPLAEPQAGCAPTATVTVTVTASAGASLKASASLSVALPVVASSGNTFSATSRTSTQTSSSSTSRASSSSSTSSSTSAVVTDAAYISTVMRHHNIHRANHSASQLTWSASLANTARIIAETCVYEHNTTINANLGAYGQNIGGGFLPTQMGYFISTMLYNSEVGFYPGYLTEPALDNFHAWGHFSQIVWKSTTAVGCYTADCSKFGGLKNVPSGVLPYFSVCNYSPPGNVVGIFKANVGASVGLPSVQMSYGCTNQTNPNVNCVGPNI